VKSLLFLVLAQASLGAALGACSSARREALPPLRETLASCGQGARPGPHGCEPIPCAPNEAIDYGLGTCVSAKTLREIAEHQGTTLYEDEQLACPDEQRLLVSGDAALCVPPEIMCLRGTRWVTAARACVPWGPCAPGAIRDPPRGVCVQVVTARGGDPVDDVVDVGAWARLAFGSDGGPGASTLCSAIARNPNAFGLAMQGSATLTIDIDLSFPNNDVSLVAVRARASSESGSTASSAAVTALDAAVMPIVRHLGALGGTASAAATHTSVRCSVRNLARPHAAPRRLSCGDENVCPADKTK
jgi:hypothetical protein